MTFRIIISKFDLRFLLLWCSRSVNPREVQAQGIFLWKDSYRKDSSLWQNHAGRSPLNNDRIGRDSMLCKYSHRNSVPYPQDFFLDDQDPRIHILNLQIQILHVFQRWLTKVGIRNLSLHLRNSAILWTTILTAELRTKKVADLQNLTSAIPQLSPVSCQSTTF